MSGILEIYLPIADVSISLLTLISISLGTGILAGMFGMGGGIIIVPMLIWVGIPAQTAIANATNQMTASAFSGYLSYARRNRVDYKLGTFMLIGSIIGAFLGMRLFHYLNEEGQIHLFVSLTFITLLSIFFILSSRDLYILLSKRFKEAIVEAKVSRNRGGKFEIHLPWQMNFASTKRTISIASPIFIGLISGILVVVIGISGSLILIPTLLYILKISPAYTAGTTHFQMIFTTIIGTILHAFSLNSVDMLLAVVLIVGAVLGTQIGVRLAAKIENETLKILLALTIILLFIRTLATLFATPESLYVIETLK